MGQVTIYLDDELEAQLRQRAASLQISKSRWIAQLIAAELANEWPPEVAALAGAWPDFPDVSEIRADSGIDVDRESF